MPATSFSDFLKLGIAHIFTGYDHLVFLFALLLVCVRWQQLVLIVTCFTIGHSLTLILATLGLIPAPAHLVEPVIALTILFVGAENFWRKGESSRGRWLVTLLFGLVHGLGFAGVLRELGVGADGRGLVLPLLAFNLGVEIGQMVFAALLLPVFLALRQKETFVRRGVPALSVIIALTGLYWLAERTLLV